MNKKKKIENFIPFRYISRKVGHGLEPGMEKMAFQTER